MLPGFGVMYFCVSKKKRILKYANKNTSQVLNNELSGLFVHKSLLGSAETLLATLSKKRSGVQQLLKTLSKTNAKTIRLCEQREDSSSSSSNQTKQ